MANVQIRDVPPDLHRALKERASRRKQSLSRYLLDELAEIAGRPTMEELIERVRSRELYSFEESSADLIRQEREERDGRW